MKITLPYFLRAPASRRALLVLMFPVLAGFGPCSAGPAMLERVPGGVLNGKLVTEAVDDWSFVSDTGLCTVETRPEFPHSVRVNCFNDGPRLYVGCMSCQGKIWSDYITRQPVGTILIEDRLYPVSFRRVTDDAEMLSAWTQRISKLRPAAEVPPVPAGYWLYELTSR
ncbi:MAG: hypothetical protein KDI36_06605 [Pseudomonadales bacterium]|nr:hypothetical protein [Pseudomonadales bacterium]